MIRIGVTGTDTGVGKTVVTCALAAALVRRGLRVAAMKPVETGVAPDDPSRDGARLRARRRRRAAAVAITAPITLPASRARRSSPRAAPAERSTSTRSTRRVRDASRGHDVLLVEGAGGLLVPITERVSFDALFARWALDLVVVAANRLGVINHVRLTLAAARAAGLRVARRRAQSSSRPTPADSSIADNARVIDGARARSDRRASVDAATRTILMPIATRRRAQRTWSS